MLPLVTHWIKWCNIVCVYIAYQTASSFPMADDCSSFDSHFSDWSLYYDENITIHFDEDDELYSLKLNNNLTKRWLFSIDTLYTLSPQHQESQFTVDIYGDPLLEGQVPSTSNHPKFFIHDDNRYIGVAFSM